MVWTKDVKDVAASSEEKKRRPQKRLMDVLKEDAR